MTQAIIANDSLGVLAGKDCEHTSSFAFPFDRWCLEQQSASLCQRRALGSRSIGLQRLCGSPCWPVQYRGERPASCCRHLRAVGRRQGVTSLMFLHLWSRAYASSAIAVTKRDLPQTRFGSRPRQQVSRPVARSDGTWVLKIQVLSGS